MLGVKYFVGKTIIRTEISHQQSTIRQKYKRTCTTVLKVLFLLWNGTQ